MEIYIITYLAYRDGVFLPEVFTVWTSAENAQEAAEKAKAYADKEYFSAANFDDIRATVCRQDKHELKNLLDRICVESGAEDQILTGAMSVAKNLVKMCEQLGREASRAGLGGISLPEPNKSFEEFFKTEPNKPGKTEFIN